MPSPRRVMVLRTSRFAGAAAAYARRGWPDAEIRVLYQRGAEEELRAAGVDPSPSDALGAGARITPRTLLMERAGRRALRWRPDVVVIQWWNPVGRGHEAADIAALMIGGRGFHAVFEDGGAVWVPAGPRLVRPLLPLWAIARGALLVGALTAGTLAAWPLITWTDWRTRIRTP